MSDAGGKLRFLLELQENLGGCIPFERWMREALYHREFGYYTANIREFGRRGDFTTWPALDKGLGRAIAGWALQNRPSKRWDLIEIGAGSGELAASILKTIGWWNRPRYHIVEISPRLRQVQQGRLGSRANWHASVPEALAACGGTALILSNELVDAFPCRVFEKRPDGWRELALRLEEGASRRSGLSARFPTRPHSCIPGRMASGSKCRRVFSCGGAVGCPRWWPAACSLSTMAILALHSISGVPAEPSGPTRITSGWKAVTSMAALVFATLPPT